MSDLHFPDWIFEPVIRNDKRCLRVTNIKTKYKTTVDIYYIKGRVVLGYDHPDVTPITEDLSDYIKQLFKIIYSL